MTEALESHASMSEITGNGSRERGAGNSSNAMDKMPTNTGPGAELRASLPQQVTIAPGKTIDKKSFEYIWRSGVAGGIAGCAAKTVVAPLDRVKILFQSSNPHFAKYSGSWAGVGRSLSIIYHQEGPVGLFRGHSATILKVFPYAAIKFLAYEQIRAVVIPDKHHETPLRRLLSGSLAGVTSVFVTYPLEVVRVRMAFETRHGRGGLVQICKQIYSEIPGNGNGKGAIATAAASTAATTTTAPPPPRPAGLVNFYRGFSPTILGMLPYAGISFMTHDTAGDILRSPAFAPYTVLPHLPPNHPPGKPAPLRSWAELLAGGVAGLVSQTASYPLEVIRRRMQVGGAVGDGHRLRIGETARLIIAEKGMRGFFVGLTIGYVKIVPLTAVSFYTYERMKTFLGI